MTKQPSQWTRRTFSKGLVTLAGMPYLGWQALAETLHDGVAGHAYVGSCPAGGEGAIHVFHTVGRQWRPVQTIAAADPAHLERHPTLPVLYAVHAVALWNNLPRGAVSAYSIEPSSGRLLLLNTQPLSLSATSPRHATVTRDGIRLVVAAQEGGSYNLLPIAADGSLRAPESCRKELGLIDGSIIKAAQPRHVVCHPDGSTLFTADAGNEAIHSFAIESGLMLLQDRRRVHAGAGPSQIALSQCGQWIYALNAADGSLSVHQWNHNSNKIFAASQILAVRRPGATLMAMHPMGRFLVTAGAEERALGLTSWSIDSRSGRLALVGAAKQSEAHDALTFSPGGEHLIGTNKRSGRIVRSSFDFKAGGISNQESISHVDSPSCLALHSV